VIDELLRKNYEYNAWARGGIIRNAPLGVWSGFACSAPFSFHDPKVKPLLEAFSAYERNEVVKPLIADLDRRGIAGDIIEFGVARGFNIDLLATVSEELGSDRRIYGFDSFEGLPEPEPGRDLLGYHRGRYAVPLEAAQARIRASERPNIHLVKGWLAETLKNEPALSIPAVAYARIDVDLYKSTLECLDYLAPRLTDQAVLVFDEWTYDLGTGETGAFFEWSRKHPEFSFDFIFSGMIGRLYLRTVKAG